MPNTSGQAYGLTVLTPIEIGSEAILRAYIEGMPEDEKSPFAQLPGTHFVRLVIIDQLKYQGEPQDRDTLHSEYLLFESNFDTHDLDGYLTAMCRNLPEIVNQIWGRCAMFPGTADEAAFLTYMKHNQVPVTFFYTAYPDATLEDVRSALRFREQFTRFAVDSQGLEAGALQERFRAAFGRG